MNKKGDEKLWYRGGTFAKLLLASKRNKYYIIWVCCIILQSAACCAALPFGTLFYERHEIRGIFIEHKVCVPIFSTIFSETW